MKKLFTMLAATMISVMSFAQITISGGNLISTTGGNLSLSPKVLSSVTLTGVTWSIDNSNITSLTNATTTGATLNALHNGTVIVTAVGITSANNTITGTLSVTINNQIETLTLSGSSSLLATNTNDAITLTVTGNLAKISTDNLLWDVSPSSIAGVNSGSFVLEAKSNGVVVVTAKSKADPSTISNSIEVTISGFVSIASLNIAGNDAINTDAGTTTLTSSYLPLNATNPILSYSSSDGCGLELTDAPKGIFTAHRNGVYTITGTLLNGGDTLTKPFVITVTNQKPQSFFETFNLPYDGNPFGGLAGNVGSAYFTDTKTAGQGFNSQYYQSEKTNGNLSVIVTKDDGSTAGAIEVDNQFAANAKYMGIGVTKNAGFPWNWGCGVKPLPENKKVIMEVVNKSSDALTLYLGVGKEGYGDVFGGGRFEAYSVSLPANSTTMYVQTVTTNVIKYLKVGVGQLQSTTVNVVFNYIAVGTDPVSSLTLSTSKSSLLSVDSLVISGTVSPASAPQEIVWSVVESQPTISLLTPTNLLSGKLFSTGLGDGTVTITGKVPTSNISQSVVVPIGTQTAVSDALPESSVSVYPNPSSTGSVTVAAPRLTINSVTLVNSVGQIITKSSTASTISTLGFPKGLYIVIIQTNTGITKKSIIIE